MQQSTLHLQHAICETAHYSSIADQSMHKTEWRAFITNACNHLSDRQVATQSRLPPWRELDSLISNLCHWGTCQSQPSYGIRIEDSSNFSVTASGDQVASDSGYIPHSLPESCAARAAQNASLASAATPSTSAVGQIPKTAHKAHPWQVRGYMRAQNANAFQPKGMDAPAQAAMYQAQANGHTHWNLELHSQMLR